MLWKDGYRKYEETQKTMRPIKIKQGFSTREYDIKLVSPTEARRMLGVYTSPDGNSKLQCNILLTKSKKWRNNMTKHIMSIYETLMAYRQGVLKVWNFLWVRQAYSRPLNVTIFKP